MVIGDGVWGTCHVMEGAGFENSAEGLLKNCTSGLSVLSFLAGFRPKHPLCKCITMLGGQMHFDENQADFST